MNKKTCYTIILSSIIATTTNTTPPSEKWWACLEMATHHYMTGINKHQLPSILQEMRAQFGPLRKQLNPFIITSDENVSANSLITLKCYLGHMAIRNRDKQLFSAFLKHLECIDILSMTDENGVTLGEFCATQLQEARKKGADYGRHLLPLEQMHSKILALYDIPQTERIHKKESRDLLKRVRKNVPPLKRTVGFKVVKK